MQAFKIVQNLSEHENAFSLDLLECAVDVIKWGKGREGKGREGKGGLLRKWS